MSIKRFDSHFIFLKLFMVYYFIFTFICLFLKIYHEWMRNRRKMRKINGKDFPHLKLSIEISANGRFVALFA